MAARLVQAGFRVSVYNRSRGPERELVKLGATAFATPRECASGADIVITMLSDAEALASVLDNRSRVELSLTLALYVGLAHMTAAVDLPTD